MGILTGYRSKQYHKSFDSVGSIEYVNDLPFLVRSTPGGYVDAMSIYPFISIGNNHSCSFQSILREKTEKKDWVSSVIVTDPMDGPPQVYDNAKMEKYRDHYIIDLPSWDLKNCSKNTRKNVKRLLKGDCYDIVSHSGNMYLNDFHSFYSNTVKKYNVSGLLDFSKKQLDQQVKTPGSVLFDMMNLCSYGDYLEIGTQLYYIQGDCAYWHLSGYTQECSNIAGSFLLTYTAINYFKHLGLQTLVLGSSGGNPGLESYKSGFSTGVKENFIIKTVHNQEIYDKLIIPGNQFFPQYRTQI